VGLMLDAVYYLTTLVATLFPHSPSELTRSEVNLGIKSLLPSNSNYPYLTTHFVQCGCHRLDEHLLTNLRIENGEVLARCPQHCCTPSGHVLHCCLVLAHQVEQSAHLPRGLLRLPACLH